METATNDIAELAGLPICLDKPDHLISEDDSTIFDYHRNVWMGYTLVTSHHRPVSNYSSQLVVVSTLPSAAVNVIVSKDGRHHRSLDR